MSDALFADSLDDLAPVEQPALPEPALLRWQPLRIGLVELFHYDSEEFWFRDGHLLLRGNNGTGKSKVLALTLPFLLDARLQSYRVEPDGDPGKKMAWNLLVGKHERRTGYAWIEFGRIDEGGQLRYLTLGCGMSAVATRSKVESWFFTMDQQRMGADLWLINPQHAVLSRERLELALGRHGHVHENADTYRRAVDERLFQLGDARYRALMDTLIQLRQPQLSRRPDESNLSSALSEALPPLPEDLLSDVADAMNQLEQYRSRLDDLAALAKALGQFNRHYQAYAQVNARRHAHALRAAQTQFDNASHAVKVTRSGHDAAASAEITLRQQLEALDEHARRDRAALEEILQDPLQRDATRLEELERNLAQRSSALDAARIALQTVTQRHLAELAIREQTARDAMAACAALEQALDDARQIAHAGGVTGFGEDQLFDSVFAKPALLAKLTAPEYAALPVQLRERSAQRRANLAAVTVLLRGADDAQRTCIDAARKQAERADDLAESRACAAAAEQALEAQGGALFDAWQDHAASARELHVPDMDTVLAALARWIRTLEGEDPARLALAGTAREHSAAVAQQEAIQHTQQQVLSLQRSALEQERSQLASGVDQVPPSPYQRASDTRPAGRPGAPLWRLIDFRPGPDLAAHTHGGIEAALEASGLLDAWIDPGGDIAWSSADGRFDTLLTERPPQVDSLAGWLAPDVNACADAGIEPAHVERLLKAVAGADQDPGNVEAWVAPDGRFRLGALQGHWMKQAAVYIGAASRARARNQRIVAIDALLLTIGEHQDAVRDALTTLALRRTRAAQEWGDAPADTLLRGAHLAAGEQERRRRQALALVEQADQQAAAADACWQAARGHLQVDAEDLALPWDYAGLARVATLLDQFDQVAHGLLLQANHVRHVLPDLARQQTRTDDVQRDVSAHDAVLTVCSIDHADADARFQTLRERSGTRIEELKQGVAHARKAVSDCDQALEGLRARPADAGESRATLAQRVTDTTVTLEERVATRQQAMHALERFCACGLLAVALPEQGAGIHPWTIDAALGVARRTDQSLQNVGFDDAGWARIQASVSHDFTDLLRSLSALGHQAQAEHSDAGMIVTIAERLRADNDISTSGTLLETLSRALDYRRWHRFRVQRWQDGQWRALAGPASSGERALGLTVPLFAAVSSFYTTAGSRHAPRLVLLDEAFVGIDVPARAHCMALVREFDLDFIITSEHEWGCYAALPGVSICQLQRREGIDAVHVSRWRWDGRAKRREAEVARRLPPTPDAHDAT
ncbi:MAG: TIGR02680 family protein [Pseudomonadota bacterium]|nr:TIGR02680 family protein [Pseudomonadota bacterium]